MPRSKLFLVLLVPLGFLTGCGQQENHAATGPDKTVVRVSTPSERQVTDYEYFTGRTDAVDHVDIRARVTGYLVKVEFKAGFEVKAEQLLFQIDPRPYKAQLDQAKGQVLLNEANLKLADANLARGKEVAKTPGAISLQDLDKLAAQQESADASVRAAKANLETADLNLKFTEVTAPVAGIVGRNLLTIGNLVLQDSTLLTTIVSMDPMYAYFDVDEQTMLRVHKLIREGKIKSAKEGAKIPVQLGLANEGDQYPHEGLVDFVNNEVDTSTGTIQVRAVLANPKAGVGASRLFTPGLFVRVRLAIGEAHKALLVPQSALGTDQGKKFLYVVNDKSIVEYRPVVPGAQQADSLQEVTPIKIVRTKEGIRPAAEGESGEESLRLTDRIIVGGLQRVRAGMQVEAKAAAEAGK